MQHEDATLSRASSRYLLRQMSIVEMDEFEEHFFSCPECAADVKADNVFASSVRQYFRQTERSPYRWSIIGYSFDMRVPLALAACLILTIITYQNAFLIPSLERNVALLSNPQAPFPVVLQLARDETAVTTIPKDYVFFNPQFYRASATKSPSYLCDIEKGSGTRIKSISLTAPGDGDPFSFKLLRSEFPSGMYRFKLRGPDDGKLLATYTIVLNTD